MINDWSPYATRKMRRALPLTIDGEFGLTEGSGLWMDTEVLSFATPELLKVGDAHAIRVDIGSLGRMVDVNVQVVHVFPRDQARHAGGYIHVGRWALNRDRDSAALEACLLRVNPNLSPRDFHPSASRSVGSGTDQRRRDSISAVDSTRGRARRRTQPSHTVRAHSPTGPATASIGPASWSRQQPSSASEVGGSSGRRRMVSRLQQDGRRSWTPPDPNRIPYASKDDGAPPTRERKMRGRVGLRDDSADPTVSTLSVASVAQGATPSVLVHFPTRAAMATGLKLRADQVRISVAPLPGIKVGERVTVVVQLPDATFVQFRGRVSKQRPHRTVLAGDFLQPDVLTALARNTA